MLPGVTDIETSRFAEYLDVYISMFVANSKVISLLQRRSQCALCKKICCYFMKTKFCVTKFVVGYPMHSTP